MSKEKKAKVIPIKKEEPTDPSNPNTNIWEDSETLEAAIQASLKPLTKENAKLQAKIDQMRTAIDMMQRNSTIIEIFFGALHDINNLLTYISGYTVLLKIKDFESRESERVAFDSVIKASDNCGEIVSNLYSLFSGCDLDRNTIDPTEFIREITTLIPPSIRVGTKIKLDENSIENALIKINKAQFCQIILNLVKNACEACEGNKNGGQVEIRVKLLPQDQHYPVLISDKPNRGPLVMITIKDNGCGMTENTKRKLFNTFFTTKAQQDKIGRGIGLATTKRLIHENEGFIEVVSTPKEGTCFYVFFPEA